MNETKQNLTFAETSLNDSVKDLMRISYKQVSEKDLVYLKKIYNKLDLDMMKLLVILDRLET